MNRKQILTGTSIAAITAILIGWAPMTSVLAEPATVGMGTTGCGLLDGNGNIVLSDSFQTVATNNGKGTGKFTCHAANVPNPTGKAVHWDNDNMPMSCGTISGPTIIWKNVVSDNGDGTGDATLQCRTK